MLQYIAAVIGGLVVLIWSADRFVLGASGTARNLGMSTLVIGLTVVAIGTSAPELMISSLAAFQGNPQLAIGNALGSNIANIALILGVTAALAPVPVRSQTLRRELPLLMGVMVYAYLILADRHLSIIDGVLLLGGLALLLVWLIRAANRADTQDPMRQELESEIPADMPLGRAIFWLALGLGLLLASSQALVWGASNIASALGVSDLVIGLTIVAVGTSLPELAAAVASVRKNEHDLAVGNVIGSNFFNTLGVIGIPAIIHPGAVAPEAVDRDLMINIGLTVLMVAMAYGLRQQSRILRAEGVILLTCFGAYQTMLFFNAN